VSSNSDLVSYRIERSWETLAEARVMAQTGHWNGCVNRLYYACFYAVNALLLSQGLSSAKHTGVRGLFSLHFVKTGAFPKDLAALYNTLFDSRQESDYADFFLVDPVEAALWQEQTELFIKQIATMLPGADISV